MANQNPMFNETFPFKEAPALMDTTCGGNPGTHLHFLSVFVRRYRYFLFLWEAGKIKPMLDPQKYVSRQTRMQTMALVFWKRGFPAPMTEQFITGPLFPWPQPPYLPQTSQKMIKLSWLSTRPLTRKLGGQPQHAWVRFDRFPAKSYGRCHKQTPGALHAGAFGKVLGVAFTASQAEIKTRGMHNL